MALSQTHDKVDQQYGGNRMAVVHDNLVVARPLAGGSGYTWTMASRSGEILQTLEERYGPRDHSFTLLGVEFCES